MEQEYAVSRWLKDSEDANMPFVIEIGDCYAEAASPHHLCNLIFHPTFTDLSNGKEMEKAMLHSLKEIARTYFRMSRQRVIVYSEKGKYYDNAIEGERLRSSFFVNPYRPIKLDGYNPYTAICSLIRSDYMRLWERIPVFSEQHKIGGCSNCALKGKWHDPIPCKGWYGRSDKRKWMHNECCWVTNNNEIDRYVSVNSQRMTVEFWHFPNWQPIGVRHGIEKRR